MGKTVNFILFATLAIFILVHIVIYFYSAPTLNNQSITTTPPQKTEAPLLRSEVEQFYSNMRFNHNEITYSFHASCTDKNRRRVQEAFNIIGEKVGIVSFAEVITRADIKIVCDEKEVKTSEQTFLSGEGGPTELYNLSLYPLIAEGQVLLYEQKIECDTPMVEIHEIMHVFGYEHVNNSNSLMSPFLKDCDQKLDQAMIDHMIELYSIEAKPELFFRERIIGNISGNYLNFEAKITNQGLLPTNVELLIRTGDKEIKTFNLGEINHGVTKTFTAENVRLPRSLGEIIFEIVSEDDEYSKTDNIETFVLE